MNIQEYATDAAVETFELWRKACVENSGSNNQWNAKGVDYFFEVGHVEHFDGSLTGTVWRFLPAGVECVYSSSFKIRGDGRVLRAPAFLRKAANGLLIQ